MNAAFGTRFAPPFFFAAFFAPPLFAAPRDFLAPPFFAPPFLAAFFPFFAAILSPGRWNGWGKIPLKCADSPYENRPPSTAKGIIIGVGRNRECAFSPLRSMCNRSISPMKTTDRENGRTLELAHFPREFRSTVHRSPSSELLAQPVGDRAKYLRTNAQRRQFSIVKTARRIGDEEVIRLGKYTHRHS